MKILHISAFAFRGGCEKNCYHFIQGSPQFEHELVVLGGEGPMTQDWAGLNIEVRHLGIVNINLFQFGKKLKRSLAGSHCDLAICWSTIRLPAQLYALQTVVTEVRVHLGNPLSHNPWKDVVLGILLPTSCAVTLMACSDYVAASYANAPYFKAFTMKTSLNPVSVPEAIPVREPHKGFRIGMVARLDPIKDHATLINAFEIVAKTLPLVELHLVGDGILREKLTKMVMKKGIGEKVFFYGDVSNVYEKLNQWDVFVYSTTPAEGLGSVVAEAMANGLPCILCELPMMRELAPHEVLVLWFGEKDYSRLAEQLLAVFRSPDLALKMGHSAYEYSKKHFNASRFIKAYL